MTARTQETRSRSTAHAARQAPPAVACNLKRLRLRRGYTLEGLAQVSGIELDALRRIELAQNVPTIKVLWSLATALGVPFGALISPQGSSESESDLVSSEPDERQGGLVCRPVLPSGRGPRRTEVYELKLSAHGSRVAAPRPDGAMDNLLVTSGTVVISVGKVSHLLKTGDSVDFRSDVERTYTNPSDRDTTMYVVITYAANVG